MTANKIAYFPSTKKRPLGIGSQPKYKSILELSDTEVCKFLLKSESYCNFDLPAYFNFNAILSGLAQELTGKQLSDFRTSNPRDYENINHVVLHNKDGKYAWRPLQLIHPAIYVALVQKITEAKTWEIIRTRFKEFSDNPKIECISLPLESLSAQKDKAEQILHWWQDVEQKSIEFALDFEYLIKTDITDCYGSIYTHTIAWGLHGKDFAKTNRQKKDLIGNIIDSYIQDMSHGQTNCIPQGSTLMDFIAEMVLGYADLDLSKKIQENNIEDYHILRYRDDYRIFVNNPQDGERIVKILTEILIDLGLKLNPSKTNASSHVITDSIKGDKLDWLYRKQQDENVQKQLLIIHDLTSKHPNSGSVITALNDFNKRITSLRVIKGSLLPLISIVTDIAFRNPRSYAIASAILSKFISFIKGKDQKIAIINRIKKRFEQIPNTGNLQIWLQRITITFDKSYVYDEPLCKIAAGEAISIWQVDWLSQKLGKLIRPETIIDKTKLRSLPSVISHEEVEVFMSKIWDY